MQIHPPYRRLLRLCPLLLLLWVTVACGASATPTPVPTSFPTPLPTSTTAPLSARSALAQVTRATAAPVPQATPTPATGTAALASFTIPLPATWQYQLLAGAMRTDELQQLRTANPTLGRWVEQVEALPVDDQPWLLAWPTAGDSVVGLLAYITPSFDLSIQRYLEALQRLLEETETIVVHEAALDYTVHESHPVGYLHYTLTAAQPTNGTNEQPDQVAGHQYLIFDQEGTTLLVMTFILSQERAPVEQSLHERKMLDEFIAIVQSVSLNVQE